MENFTTILNRGIRRHIDKNVKKRRFGKCDNCGKRALLVEYEDPYDNELAYKLCDFCYDDFLINDEIE